MNLKTKEYIERTINRKKNLLEALLKGQREKTMLKIENNKYVSFIDSDYEERIERTKKEIQMLENLLNMNNEELITYLKKHQEDRTIQIIAIMENLTPFRIYEKAINIENLERDYLDFIQYFKEKINPNFSHFGIMSVRGAGYDDFYIRVDSKNYIVKQINDKGISKVIPTTVPIRSYDAGMYSKRYLETI